MTKRKKPEYPILRAEEITRYGRKVWRVWCPFCAIFHFHSPGRGHQIAHCSPGSNSPFRQLGGYILIRAKYDYRS